MDLRTPDKVTGLYFVAVEVRFFNFLMGYFQMYEFFEFFEIFMIFSGLEIFSLFFRSFSIYYA